MEGGRTFPFKIIMEITELAGSIYGSIWFFRYLLFHSSDAGQIWYSRKAIHQENPTPYVTRSLEQNSLRTSDNTGITPPGHIDGYWHLPYGEFPIQSLDLERRQSSLSSKTFPEVFGMVLGRKASLIRGESSRLLPSPSPIFQGLSATCRLSKSNEGLVQFVTCDVPTVTFNHPHALA